MKTDIDARGLSCPQPVMLAKGSMKGYTHIEITVDNETAVENLKRLASSSGWSFESLVSGADIKVTLKSAGVQSSEKQTLTDNGKSSAGTVVVFSSDRMGMGDDDLGAILIKAFINTLAGSDNVPSKILFYNSGVKLTAEGSGVTDDLATLQSNGTELLICGTCVNYYNIKEKIHAGTISNMYDILEAMKSSSKIINP